MIRYIAKQNTMFGIKKGDFLKYDEKKKKTYRENGVTEVPFDVTQETTFFEIVIELLGRFKKDDNVCMVEARDLIITKAPANGARSGSRFRIGKFVPMKVIDLVDAYAVGKVGKKKTPDYIVEIGEYQYRVEESVLEIADTYWFINSSGEVCPALSAKDKKGIEFRAMTNNHFKTKDLANAHLTKIINSCGLSMDEWNAKWKVEEKADKKKK